ncbi:MAG: sulfotransferase domain-containing protein, partial [Thermoanaerobaculia bacterium]
MDRPNFLILGAAKSGTTSLYHYLGQHAEVFFSEPKEPTFFEASWERGLEHYWRSYFAGWGGQPAVGEARAYNLFLPYVPDRIRQSVPDARLIAVLRHPVERAHSHWWHRFARAQERLPFVEALRRNRRELEQGRTFAGAAGPRQWRRGLDRNTSATRYGLYLELGLYAEQLERYLSLFPRSRIRVVFFEDLRRDPRAVTRELWGFLGLAADRPLVDPRPQNVAPEVQWSAGELRVRRWARALLPLTRRLPGGLKARVRASFG